MYTCVCMQVSRMETATTMKKRRRTTIGKLCHLVEGCVHTEQCPHYLRRRNVAMTWQMLATNRSFDYYRFDRPGPISTDRINPRGNGHGFFLTPFSLPPRRRLIVDNRRDRKRRKETRTMFSTGFEACREPADRLDSLQTWPKIRINFSGILFRPRHHTP